MDKTSQKVTKDPRSVEAARKGRENSMNTLKENNLKIQEKVVKILAMQAIKLPAPPTLPPPLPPELLAPSPQDLVILISMALVYLLPLPLVFAYFLRTAKRQNKSSMKNLLDQKDVICFRSDDEKTLYNK